MIFTFVDNELEIDITVDDSVVSTSSLVSTSLIYEEEDEDKAERPEESD